MVSPGLQRFRFYGAITPQVKRPLDSRPFAVPFGRLLGVPTFTFDALDACSGQAIHSSLFTYHL